MKTSLEDINPFRKFAMVLSRFNLLLPRLKALCGASYPQKFRHNLMSNFFGIASSRSVIGSGNSCHPLNQSDNKPRTKRACPHVFSRASGSLPALTLKSDWLLVTFPFILIALFSLWYHSIVLRFFQVLSIECPKTETFVLHLTGWNGGASFLVQSKSKVKQNRCNSGSLSIINWKVLYSTC